MSKPIKPKDPLLELFEHFLLTRSYENAAQFTKQLAENYLAYLDSTPSHMPIEARQGFLEDLASEGHEMLVKRMYGCFPRAEYEDTGRVRQFRDGKVTETLPLQMPDVSKPVPPTDK